MGKVIEADFLPRESDINIFSSTVHRRPSFNTTRRVLVVDNNSDTTRLIKVLLENNGDYFVLEENDSTKAHQTARNFRPDVILLDVAMPDTDGGEVAAQIQGDPKLRGTPIIFLTALARRTRLRAALRFKGIHFSLSQSAFPS